MATKLDFEKEFLLNYKKIGLNDDEALLLLLAYAIVQNGTKFVNPSDLTYLCSFSSTKIDVVYSSLTKKGYISTDILENGSVVTSFDNTIKALKELQTEKEDEVNDEEIKDMMEKFFGRPLTAIEYDVIQNWKDKKYPASLIKAACDLASQIGNKSIRYIDTIIFEENKKKELGDEEYQRRQQETIDISKVDWLNK